MMKKKHQYNNSDKTKERKKTAFDYANTKHPPENKNTIEQKEIHKRRAEKRKKRGAARVLFVCLFVAVLMTQKDE
jgi:hypothetical protein